MTNEEFEIQKLEVERQADEKAKQLSIELGRPVYPFVFHNGNGFLVGYLKEPARLDKMRAIDMYEQSRTQAGDLILRTSLITEHSAVEILDEKPQNDSVYLGAIGFAIKRVEIAAELLKKK
jgi:hypothetical protein